jgi:hypothetical protein
MLEDTSSNTRTTKAGARLTPQCIVIGANIMETVSMTLDLRDIDFHWRACADEMLRGTGGAETEN